MLIKVDAVEADEHSEEYSGSCAFVHLISLKVKH